MRRAAGSGTRVDTALLALCVMLALVLKASSDDMREGLASLLRRTVLAPLFSMQASVEHWRMAIAVHDAVVASRDSALMRAQELTALELENESLRRFLALGARLRWGFLPAQVLREASLGGQTTVMLTAGAAEGVKRLSPVIAPDGIVGVVESVDEHRSIAMLWTDPNFAVSAMPEDGSAFGIVTPHLGAGADRYLLELRNVQFRYSLKPGTRIVATGIGGIWPAMVPIGTIVGELETSTTWARTYLVRPAVLPQDLTAVLILDPERASAGVPGVWQSSAVRDSIHQLIIARGDSIARAKFDADIKAAAAAELERLRASPDTGGALRGPPPARGGGSGGGPK